MIRRPNRWVLPGYWWLLPAALLVVQPIKARAQWNPRPYPEIRADGIVGRGSALQLGAGPVVPVGYYVRIGIIGAAGVVRRGGATLADERIDVTARYLLDPFRETRDALSLGGGVSLVSEERHVRPYLVLVADLEGRRHDAWTPALQLGLGGGARVGVVLRRSRAQAR